jgi:phage tail-like protein
VDRDVRVRLFDATRQPVLTWRFRNAFPVVYRLSPLEAASSDAVIETIELAFDSMDTEL